MFVKVIIEGKRLEDIIRVEPHAVHNGNEVWVVRNDKLHIQTVEVMHRDRDYAYISSGLADGDIIVTSPLDTVTEGMKIRTQLEQDDESRDLLLPTLFESFQWPWLQQPCMEFLL